MPSPEALRRGGTQPIPRPTGWRTGPPAPWLERADPPTLPLAAVRRRLADLPAPRDFPEAVTAMPIERRASAVLVPLFEVAGETRLILTKRPETMPSHQGQIAFPGGKMEEGVDVDLRATALREAHEEIGLDPAAVEIVAQLDGLGTIGSRFMITPFVGVLASEPALRPDPREVVRVFDVALVDLLAPGVHHAEHWSTPMAELDVQFFDLAGETIWGATARILYGFLRFLVADG
ncbi:MAG: CoA pyrophosphatase [Acidimicrobiia bacterium]|nr:CoA pyrophosphatase [Acidimicrobiia bacterium]